MGTSADDRKTAAIEELVKGRGYAARLSSLVQKAWPGDSSAAGALIKEVMYSFSRALDDLDSDASGRNPAADGICIDEVKSENCVKKRKASGAGRGGFRKRKQALSTVISKANHDEYSWRKYGQKEIHSSKFPRSYFRCTHKYDQGCRATKQVQKSEDDPSLLEITYIGEHTCTNHHRIRPSNSSDPSVISFGSSTSNVTHAFSLPSSPLLSKTPENEEEVLSIPTHAAPSSDFFDLPDLYEGSLLDPLMREPALIAGDFDARFVFGSSNFEGDVFNLDQAQLFRDWPL